VIVVSDQPCYPPASMKNYDDLKTFDLL
jgi:hypothetical protein